MSAPMSHAPEKSFWKRIPRKWLFLFLYALLVCASNAWRDHHPYVLPLAPDQKSEQIREFNSTTKDGEPTCDPTGRDIRIAYRDIAANRADAPTLVLLHGTPGDSRNILSLSEALRGKFRLIVPDLPGHGASEHTIADYSIECAARETLDLLDKLGVKKAHVLGFGMGGGTALEMSHLAPERVKSLALVSSIGSQEFDLMGNHLVNKIVYTFQMAGFKVFKDFIPHFGALDGMTLNKSYAHTVWESDLTPLKEHTRKWKGPLLLAHGEEDWSVAPDTARYAKELAPHAETLFVAGGHDVFIKEANRHAPAIAVFVDKAEAGQAAVAAPTVGESPMPKPPVAQGSRHWVLMAIILCCTLVAEDPTCLATGLLVGTGLIDFWSGTAACLVGIFVGDLFLYLVGRVLGRAALTKAPFKWFISEYDVDRMSTRFGSTKGMAVIVTSRFIPGSRVPTFVAAGIMKLNPAKLGLLFFIAAALWTPPLVWFAMKTGDTVMERFQKLHHLAGWIAAGLLLAIFVIFHFVVPSFTWIGRRHLLAKMRGLTNHALMPGWLLCLPGSLHAFGLWIRHRSAGIYAAANPTLGRLGGASGESKAALLAPFAGDASVVPSEKVPAGASPEDRAGTALTLLAKRGATFPVVLKPDGAENGIGVFVAENEARLRAWFSAFKDDALVQPRCSGREYEVVWHRAPGETTGRILAVVEKLRTHVTGDGKHRLEHLVWAGDESLDHAELFVRLNAGKEDSIPAAGEVVTLSESGSLAKGARVSLRHGLADAPAANEALNALAERHPGVHWLRLDIFSESDETFAAAKDWNITEIEGAGKYSSLLRDPNIRPADAHLRLARQRAACFAAGAANVARSANHRKPSAFDLLATWSEARETREPRL
jgi:pimeloyl-ACP methyl ester carboxylesterase/membrane protein DedA with SNARE-associated domain